MVSVVSNGKCHTNAIDVTNNFKAVDTNTTTTNGNKIMSSILKVIDPKYVDNNIEKKIEYPCDIKDSCMPEKGCLQTKTTMIKL